MGLSMKQTQASLPRKERFIAGGYLMTLNPIMQNVMSIDPFDPKTLAVLKELLDLVKEIDSEYPDLAKLAVEYKLERQKKMMAAQQIGQMGVPTGGCDGGCGGDCGGCGSH